MLKLNDEVLAVIEQALKRGNTVEIKKVNGQIQVIEIDRRLKIRQAI